MAPGGQCSVITTPFFWSIFDYHTQTKKQHGQILVSTEWFKKEYPGMSVGRPDVIRMAVERLISKPPSTPNFLDALENDLANDSKKFDKKDKIPLVLKKKTKKALSKR